MAALTLDDLDWAKGLVTLSGKGQRREALPLPEDVGRALAAYLRDGRPPCETRRVFVRARARTGASVRRRPSATSFGGRWHARESTRP